MTGVAENELLIRVFDGHNDTILDLADSGRSFFERSNTGQLDRVRASEGGMIGGFFAVFVPGVSPASTGGAARFAEIVGNGLDGVPLLENDTPTLAYAQQLAIHMTSRLLRMQSHGSPGNGVTFVDSAKQLGTNIEQGTFSGILHFEGAEMIDEDLYALDTYYAAGLRSLGIVWSRSNAFGHGVPFGVGSPDTGPGLTEAGKKLVKRCNELGILLDLSHMNEQGFWDIAGLSSAPLVATHSNAHAISPSTRNLTDRQLDAIAASDGIVGVNFNCSFIRPDGQRTSDTPLEMLADHVDYLAERIGIDRIALGSDFDGAQMPNDLADASKLPNLIRVLRTRGYDDDALHKIGYRNWLRVLGLTWGA